MNLPTREDVESWDQEHLAAFMHQMKMYECATTVHRYQMNGHRFLNMTENDLRKFSPVLQPQLQKIVQDIKKHDGSLLDKLRRLKNKSVARLPARDHRGDNREESDDSDPEYDNDTYQVPGEDQDDSYETPPSQQHRMFSSGPLPRGEYADSCRGQPNPPMKKPQRPGRTAKQLPPTPNQQDNDEQDYIQPDGNSDEDYIKPDQNPSHTSRVLRELPRVPTQRPSNPVPDTEVKSQPLPIANRLGPVPLLPTPSPRPPPRPATPELSGDEYEVCDANEECSENPRKSPPLPLPKPLPRERSPMVPIKPKIPAKPSFREFENRTLPVTPSEPAEPPPKVFSLDLKRPKIPLPHFISHKQTDKDQQDESENGCGDEDEESEMLCKPWFADSCDRKTADDTLLQSNQDGAFLVRKSSGHNTQQPYTLVVFHKGHVYNIPIRFLASSQQFALGSEKKGEEFFSSVPHIIEHHQRTPLVLIDSQSNSKDATRLCFPVKP